MYICVCKAITDSMLKQNPELRSECSTQCGKCRKAVAEFFANNQPKVNSVHSK